MKKLSELKGDQFLDALFALTPLLPILEHIDLGSLDDNNITDKQRGISLLTNVITKLLPCVVSRESRHCIWDLLSILEEKPISEIKEYPAPKLLSKVRKIFAEGELTSFLSYADESDIAE